MLRILLQIPFLLLVSKFVNASPTLASVVNCLSDSNVPQEIPGTESFTQAIIPMNIRLNYTPIAFAVPTTVPQVQSAVNCAAQYGVKVNPKSGGHSYASHSLGGEDGHLVVDLKYFDSVELNNSTGLATVGPGTRLGNLALELYSQGGRAIAHGVCPSVGVGGHVLHGGQGYSSHTYGLAVDFIESAEIVLADSSLVTASSTENTDLFWALRGAGMSYGIVTSFQFRTFVPPEENVMFYYPYVWTREQATPGWTAFQEYCAGRTDPEIPAELNIRVVIVGYSTDSLLFLIEGAYHGTQDAFLTIIQPLLDALGAIGGLEESLVVTETVGWLDSLLYANNNDLFSNWGTGQPLAVPFNFTSHSNFFAKSLMTNDLTSAGVDAWVTRLYDTATINTRAWYFIVAAQGGPTSVVPLIPNSATAYAHRDQIFEWQLVDGVSSGVYPTVEGVAFLNGFVDDIEASESNITFGMYYNYADPSLTSSEAHEHYWLSNYQRLAGIKLAVDPGLLFLNPQTVGSVGNGSATN